jgi:hypothetical protein
MQLTQTEAMNPLFIAWTLVVCIFPVLHGTTWEMKRKDGYILSLFKAGYLTTCQYPVYIASVICWLPITVAARSKAWTVFARSNAGIVGSNPTEGMNICVCLFSDCIGSGLASDWYPVQEVLPTVLGLRNWSETKRFTDALCFKVGQQERERERDVD